MNKVSTGEDIFQINADCEILSSEVQQRFDAGQVTVIKQLQSFLEAVFNVTL